jgi:starch synthase
MRVLMVASEMTPFSKTGGLADVTAALPRALVRLGNEVDVVVPAYRGTARQGDPARRLPVPVGSEMFDAAFSEVTAAGVRTVLVHQDAFFDRASLYGEGGQDYPDNAERFAFLARAALEWAAVGGVKYDVVHTHDWQAGLVPVLLRHAFASHHNLGRAVSIQTIHNLAYQGSFDASWLPRLGLGWGLFRPDGLEFWGQISYLKAGIMFSDRITTVSRRYAREIQTVEYGCGFEGVIKSRSSDLVGILNGIDYDEWNPASDRHLTEPFDASTLDRKRATKRTLLEEFGLLSSAALDRPLIGLVSRLVDQKGFDLIATIADELPRLPATFVLLGTGDAGHEAVWQSLAAEHPEKIAVKIGFDEGLAHRIEGGADLFLMPSRFEPCGLNQMYSSRYGTLPLVRAVGGLADTVENLDPRTGRGTGFSFDEYTAEALLGTLRWALATFGDRALWRRMQVAGMARDFSWDASAREYVKVYGGAPDEPGSAATRRVDGEQDGI